jgi:hypothetical protein
MLSPELTKVIRLLGLISKLEIQNFAGLFFKMWYNIANQLRPVLFLAG